MKRKTIVFLTLVMVFGAVSVFAGNNNFNGSKRLTLEPSASGYMKIEMEKLTGVNVRATADQGNLNIKIVNSSGRTVASGVNRVSYRNNKKKGKFKIVVTNNTNKIQKVHLSWITIES